MSGSLWTAMLVVAVVAASVWAVTQVAGTVDLGLLPVHRRHRVEWCRSHVIQVETACGVLLAAVAVVQIGTVI
jgi:hypothetical protein